MDLKSTYNKIAADWHADHSSDTWWQEGTNHFIASVGKGASVLDVGCAGGYKASYLHKHGLQVTGIDFAESFIDIARNEVPDADFMVMDMRDVRTLDHIFDGIFAQASLLHIPKQDIPTILNGFASVLKENGCLYLAVKGKRGGGVDEEIVTEDDYGYAYQRFFSYFTTEELAAYLQNAGFEVVYTHAVEMQNTTWLEMMGKKKA